MKHLLQLLTVFSSLFFAVSFAHSEVPVNICLGTRLDTTGNVFWKNECDYMMNVVIVDYHPSSGLPLRDGIRSQELKPYGIVYPRTGLQDTQIFACKAPLVPMYPFDRAKSLDVRCGSE